MLVKNRLNGVVTRALRGVGVPGSDRDSGGETQ